jgi:hypothetical protein
MKTKPTWNQLDGFVRGYLEAALWTSEPEDRVTSGEFTKGQDYYARVTKQSVKQAQKDCAAFQEQNARDLELAECKPGREGHNFWLSRNGHGSGFFDEHSQTTCAEKLIDTCNCPYHACQRLQRAASRFGEVNPDWYRGRIYLT